MMIRFDDFKEIVKPQMWLGSPWMRYEGGKLIGAICSLVNTQNTGLTFQFNTMTQLDFTYPYSGADAAFKVLANRRYICVDGLGFFVITGCKQSSAADGSVIKTVTALSCEKELENKQIPFIPDGTYTLNELLTGKSSVDTAFPGFAGLINTSVMGAWRFAENTLGDILIPSDVGESSRTFEDVDVQSNVLSFLLDKVQDAYGCVFDFDYNTRVITINSRDSYLNSSGIQLTQKDFVDQLEIDESADSLYTAVHVVGNDDVTISPWNPLGGNIVYNFGYYYDWFSDELRTKVELWSGELADESAESKPSLYRAATKKYYTLLQQISEKELEKKQKQDALELYDRIKGNVVSATSGQPDEDVAAVAKATEYAVALKSDGEGELDAKTLQALMETIENRKLACQSRIDTIEHDIGELVAERNSAKTCADAISSELSFAEYFGDLYQELEPYIAEASYQDDFTVITDAMTYEQKYTQMGELYGRAIKQLNRVSRPTQGFVISVAGFVFSEELAAKMHDLSVGRSVWVETPCDGVLELFLSEVDMDLDDKDISMKFSNKVERSDVQSIFDSAFNKIQKTANTVQYLKDTVTPMRNNIMQEIERVMAASRNLAKDVALSSRYQEVIIDDSGYTGRQRKPESQDGYEDDWLKITNNRIIFLNGDQAKTAVGTFTDPSGNQVYGINAEYVYGKLVSGERLTVNVVVDNIEQDLSSILSVLDGKTQWMAFDPPTGLSIGAGVDKAKAAEAGYSQAIITNITNARFSFRCNGTEIAWLDGNTGAVYFSSLHASDRISIGNKSNGFFDWISTHGGLALKWRPQDSYEQVALTTITGYVTISQSGNELSASVSDCNVNSNALAYRWSKNNKIIENAQGPNLDLGGGDFGTYAVRVYGRVDMGAWGALEPAEITIQPQGGES